MKKVFSSFLLLSSVLLFSCTKEKNWLEVAQEGAGPSISFGYSLAEPLFLDIIPGGAPTFDTAINVFYSGSGGGMDVSVSVDNSVVDAYNAANGTSIPAAPASTFTAPTSITIPSGSHMGSGNLSINIAELLNNGVQFAIGLTITSPGAQSGGKSMIVLITARNAYDGLYTLVGETYHPTNTTLVGPVGPYTDVPLLTVDANSVILGIAHPWANGSGSALPGGYEPTYIIDPSTNKVTVVNTAVGEHEDPTYNNHYDPATKTIYAKWMYTSTGGDRVFTDTLTYTGPR